MKRPILVRPPEQPRRLLEPPLAVMIEELSRQHGKCFASEAALRHELHRRTGYVCGERSIGRVIKRLVGRGQWGAERVKPNQFLATGRKTYHGGTHTWIVSRFEQRKARRRAAEEERQRRRAEGKARASAERERLEAQAREEQKLAARTRVATVGVFATPPRLSDLLKPTADAASGSALHEQAERTRREVARQLAALAALDLDKPTKPPDT